MNTGINSIKKPNFFLVGAAKGGTTAISKFLGQHPEIFIPTIKEPKFFSALDNHFPHSGVGDDVVDNNVIKSLNIYESLFEGAQEYKAVGECSVDYLFFSGVPERLKKYNPKAKILISLRNPVTRAYSAYMHLVRDCRETLSFEDALEAEKERKEKNWEFFWRYIEVGMYFEQVERYMSIFPKENMVIFLYEDFVANPQRVLSECFQKIGVDLSFSPDTNNRYNVSGLPKSKFIQYLFFKKNITKRIFKQLIPKSVRENVNKKIRKINVSQLKMGDVLKNRLIDLYDRDIHKLSKLINIDLSIWKKSLL